MAAAHGLAAEEQLVREAAARLSGLLPPGAVVGRGARGSFLVFLRQELAALEVLNLARAMKESLGAGLDVEGVRLACACHSGIALAPKDGGSAEHLLNSAAIALASAREQDAPGYGFFDAAAAAAARRRRAVQCAVAAARAARSFRLAYQPIYAMGTGDLLGFEALLRLVDPQLGAIAPAEFIPAAEQSGLIAEIGEWVREEACRSAALWPPHLHVAVNLSPVQFLAGTLVSSVRCVLERHGLPPARLEVEITEGTLMKESEQVLGQLRTLRDMGISVALDDFGTGYSSLGYLWKFPFSKLKIDRSFVGALEHSASARGILRSIVKLGHGLGMGVTAEGIETARQLSALRELGCDFAQGYFLGEPAFEADLAPLMLRSVIASPIGRRRRTAAPVARRASP